jgi:hypothetical protein
MYTYAGYRLQVVHVDGASAAGMPMSGIDYDASSDEHAM